MATKGGQSFHQNQHRSNGGDELQVPFGYHPVEEHPIQECREEPGRNRKEQEPGRGTGQSALNPVLGNPDVGKKILKEFHTVHNTGFS